MRCTGDVNLFNNYNAHPCVNKAHSVAQQNVATMLHCSTNPTTKRKKIVHAKELTTTPCKN